ncbi:MAG: hypothetical protein WC867_06370 [Candidatus Pacearchaeota archaeon]|jgi:hypothetical protein
MNKKNLGTVLCIDNDEIFKSKLAEKLQDKYGFLFFNENIEPEIPFQFINAIGGIDLGIISLDSSNGLNYISRLKKLYPSSLLVATSSDLTQSTIKLLESSLSGGTLLLDKKYALENIEEFVKYS